MISDGFPIQGPRLARLTRSMRHPAEIALDRRCTPRPIHRSGPGNKEGPCAESPYRRLLPPSSMLAILAAASQSIAHIALAAQVPPVQISQQAPASASRQPDVSPVPPLTPEQRGDMLLAEKHYQAAVEAFKKAPQNSAEVWNRMGIAYQQLFNAQ